MKGMPKSAAQGMLCFLVCIILCISLPYSSALAEQNGTVMSASSDGVREVFFDDRTFHGDSARQDSYFEIGRGLSAGSGSYLELYYAHSETLLPDASSLTVMVDDVPVDSVALNADNVKETHWRIDLSALNLGAGYHKLTFNAKLKSSELICEDLQNPSSWMVIYKKSKVSLHLSSVGETADFAIYPAPFIERGAANPLKAFIIVPNDMQQDEFATAARLSQFFSAQSSAGSLALPIYYEKDISEAQLKAHHTIWIGGPDRWQGPGRTAYGSTESAGGDSGSIAVIPSPWNAAQAALLLDGSGDTLIHAAQILTEESLYRQLQGRRISVSAELAPTPATNVAAGKPFSVTLRELGYDNLSLQNAAQGSITFNYSLPNGWDIQDDATLHLKFTHSESIVFNKSVATVRLNGVPVASAKLTAITASDGLLEVPLDPSVIGTSRTLSIEIAFEFVNPAASDKLEREVGCAETTIGDWAKVDTASSISFTPVARSFAYLQSLPFPFVTDQSWNMTTFIVGHPDTSHLQLAMTLIGLIGAGGAETRDLRWISAQDANWSAQAEDRNIVYVGTTTEMPTEFRSFSGSYVKFSQETIDSQSDAVELLDPLRQNSAVMQLTDSPLGGTDRRLLLLTATSDERLSALRGILTNNENRSKLSGRLAAIDNKGDIYSFASTQDPAVPYSSETVTPKARWSDLQGSTPLFAVLLAVVLTLAFVALWMNRQRKD